MSKTKTTIIIEEALLEASQTHLKQDADSFTNFVQRAFINQLEKEGNYEIRDIMEEIAHESDNQ